MKRTVKLTRRTPGPILTKSQELYKYRDGHAEAIKQRELKKYRKRRGASFELEGSVVLRSLGFLDDEAEVLPVHNRLTDTYADMPVIRPTKLALLLNMSYQTIWRWTSDTEMLPVPILADLTQGRERMVYHVDETRVIIQAIGEHLNQFKYYRTNHTGTRNKLFTGIEEVRSQLKGADHGTKNPRKKARIKTSRRV